MSQQGMETPSNFGDRRMWVTPVTETVTPQRSGIVHEAGTPAQNDMTVSGTFRGVGDRAEFSITIAAEGAPDTFNWTATDSAGTTLGSGTAVAITGAAQHLTHGVYVTFVGTDNHSLNERWNFVFDSHESRDVQSLDGFARQITGHLRHAGVIFDTDDRALLNDLYSNAPAYRFDGVNDLVNVPDDADIDVGVDDFSIQVVFRPDSVATAVQQLVNKEAGGIGWGLELREDDLFLRIDDNTIDRTGAVALNAVVAGQVCNAVVTVNRDGSATAYVNGVAVAQDARVVSTALLTLSNAGAMRIGSSTAGTQFFKGDIYTVRVWNRLLSASEARGLSKGAAVLYADLMAVANASSTEHLQDPGGFGATWTLAGNFAAAGGGLRWLWAANGTSTATQTAANRLVAGTAGKRYRFIYDVTSITTTPNGTVAATLTTGFASAAVTLDVATTGRKFFDFIATETAATGAFVFSVVVTGGTVGQFLLDNFSLIEIGAVAEYDGDGVDTATWFDGSGNVNDGTVTSAVTVNLMTHLTVSGSVHIGGDLTVDGNLTSGTSTVLAVNTTTIEDPLIELGSGNAANVLDLGHYANYNDGAGRFTGLFRDATDGVYKLFDTLTVEPTTTVDTGGAGYDHADIQVGGLTVDDNATVTGNLVVNGNTTLGNAAADTIAFNGQGNTNLQFVRETNRTIDVAASNADTIGANLTVTAAAGGAAAAAAGGVGGGMAVAAGVGGAGAAAQLAGAGGLAIVAGGAAGANVGGGGAVGGDLSLRGGLASGAFTNGVVRIGNVSTSAVAVTPATTFTAVADFDAGQTIAAAQAITGDGALRVGVAAGAFNLSIRMGDAAGAQLTLFEDSAGVAVADINSNGLVRTDVGATGGGFDTRAAGALRIGPTSATSVVITPASTHTGLADFDAGITVAAAMAVTGDGALRVGVSAGAFNLALRMGDAVGAQFVNFEDSAGVTQASVNSDGLGTFTGLSIGSAGARPLKVIGTLGTGYVTWDTNPAAGYTVTVGAEAWLAVAAAPAGTQFLVGGSAAATMANFVTRINSDSAVARAVALDAETAAVFSRTIALGNQALASTDAGVIVSAAAMTGSEAAAEKSVIAGSYAVVARDVTTMAPGGENDEIAIRTINSTVAPVLVSFEVRDTNGVFKSKATIGARLLQSGANEWTLAVREQGGAAVLAATDVLSYLVVVTA